MTGQLDNADAQATAADAPSFSFPIELGKVREFAAATNYPAHALKTLLSHRSRLPSSPAPGCGRGPSTPRSAGTLTTPGCCTGPRNTSSSAACRGSAKR